MLSPLKPPYLGRALSPQAKEEDEERKSGGGEGDIEPLGLDEHKGDDDENKEAEPQLEDGQSDAEESGPADMETDE